MAEQLDEAVKLLILLSHRAAALDDTRLNGRVDALVNSYLAGEGTDTAFKPEQLAKAFSEKTPATAASERIHDRIVQGDA